MFLFTSRTILLQLQVIIFQEQIFKRFSLGAKERRIGADSCQQYEDLIQNILCKDSCQKYEDLITKIYCAKNLKILYKNITKWRAPFYPFAVFASLTKVVYFSITDLEPMVSCATI